jgi:poly(beta-D-mannuronate) lyase
MSRNRSSRLPTLAAGWVLAAAAVAAGGAEHHVKSADDVAKAAAVAKPGDVLVMADGEWKDQKITFAAKGTKDQPVTLRARTPGKVLLAGKSSVVIDGDHLVVSGLHFVDSDVTESAIVFKGSDNRVTDSAIVAPNRGGKWVHFREGQRNRLDHCYLAGHAPKDVTLQVEVDEKLPNEHRIDHNHFGPRPPLGANGGETMRIGYSFQQTRSSKTLVEHNLFERCDGELEIISSKSCDNVFRHNTFRECEGTITLRHGDRATVDGNFFFGAPSGKSGGVRVIGAGNTVVNNYFENCSPSAGGVIALTCGIVDAQPTGYTRVDGATVAFNTFVNCRLPYLRLDAGYDESRQRTLRPRDVVVANNVFAAPAAAAPSTRPAATAFIAGTEGEDFTWAGNIAHGAEIGSAGAGGTRIVDPRVKQGPDGVWRPADTSPVRGAAEPVVRGVTTDVDGQPRPASGADAGCDEHAADAPLKYRPLRPGDVGPSWRKPAAAAAAR